MVEPLEQPKQKRNRKDIPIREVRHRTAKVVGVTRKEFHALLKKASQPIKREAQSD